MKKLNFVLPFLLVFSILVSSCDENSNSEGQEPKPGAGAPGFGAEQFDLKTAIELMFLSIEAYQMLKDYDNGTTFTLPEAYDLVVQVLTEEGFFAGDVGEEVPIAFVATKDENIYVVFRGTKTISEWITDADFPFVPYVDPGGGMTEMGFTSLYSDISQQIIDTVTMLGTTGNFTNLYITGHSLGAALAGVSAPDLLMKTGFENPIIYTFASPRVGDSDYKTYFDAFGLDSFRVFNTNDLVPMLPPEVLGYTHVDTGFPITFGQPITDPLDFKVIGEDHDSCTYYNTLCEMLGNMEEVEDCKEDIVGLDDCNTDL